jgi:hypothetical protein
MGYTTEFNGSFQLSKPATKEQIEYLNRFSYTRRMKRDVEKLNELHKGEYGLPGIGYGTEGEFFCMNDNEFGQSKDGSIVDDNYPPSTQPGLWCQWVLTEDGTELEWDGGEKFYCYVEWLQYLIENFFSRWEIEINGTVKWQGEDMDDRGRIKVEGNKITTTELE